MIRVAVKSDDLGDRTSITKDGHSIRLSRLDQLTNLGAQLEESTQDQNGNIFFLVPEDRIDEFNNLVDGFRNDIRFCW